MQTTLKESTRAAPKWESKKNPKDVESLKNAKSFSNNSV